MTCRTLEPLCGPIVDDRRACADGTEGGGVTAERLLWFLGGSVATLLVGAVVGAYVWLCASLDRDEARARERAGESPDVTKPA